MRQGIRDDYQLTPTYSIVGADGRTSTTPAGSDDRADGVYDEVFSQRIPPYGFPKIDYVSTKNA